ncbi:TIGR03546 family protein [bacterium]|nr:TIGR03546 family protein [bacterium]
MIRQFAKLLRILNSETAPINISLAICFGMVIGFTQMWSLHNFIILFIVLFFRINLSALILGTLVFKSLSFIFNGVFHQIGLALLTADFYNNIGTYLYNITFWKFDRINNTIVAGSILVSIIGFLPMLFLFNFLIKKYREHILAFARKTKIAKALMSSEIYHYYKKNYQL